MVYYTHSVIEDYIIFDYITHNDDYFVYKLYNQNYMNRTFILIYHKDHSFNVLSENNFNLNDFQTNPQNYFHYNISSKNDYVNSLENIPLERTFGTHKYIKIQDELSNCEELYNNNININQIYKSENNSLSLNKDYQNIYHFAPNFFCVNIGTNYSIDNIDNNINKNEIESAYIIIKYNEDYYQLRYEFNRGNVCFI